MPEGIDLKTYTDRELVEFAIRQALNQGGFELMYRLGSGDDFDSLPQPQRTALADEVENRLRSILERVDVRNA